MTLNKNLLLMYRYLFFAGFIIEPFWGYYLNGMEGTHELGFLRIFGGIISLTCACLTLKPQFFIKHVNSIILTCSLFYFIGRYYLLALNPENWNYVIDLYSVFILWLIIVPTKKIMYLITPVFVLPSVFLPFYDYVAFFLMMTISPLVGSLKWVFFDLSDKYEKAQDKIKESNLLIGSQKTMSLLSHQLNNHLEKISLSNELLKLGPNTRMNDSIYDSIKTINKILFSYNIKTNINDVLSPESLDSVLSEVVQEFNNPKIKYSFNLSGAEIKMVKRLFKISVSNIISNALFEVNKKDDGYVSVEVSKTQNSLIIKITDSANSLLTENISSLFTPFYSTKNIHDGCGLGLSVSKSILEDLNANITVSTLPTTFSIRFSLDDVALVA